ncbi:hypothetical protein LWI29_026834 [Acer saccharum]|uniref:indole-3-glycerol-phosphate synthase n=1 Tax=Acer saccharum TaxID=4024 RepID=A0AA39SHY0_ACESA|nr:hypothetical protein LWI29_026834 [Acer saccharum]
MVRNLKVREYSKYIKIFPKGSYTIAEYQNAIESEMKTTIAVRKQIPAANLPASLEKHNIVPGIFYDIPDYQNALELENGITDATRIRELLPCQVSFTETSLLQLLATVFRTCFGISKLSEAAAKQETKDESATVSPANGDVETALKVKEWEVGMFHKEVAATQGIQIRRRPPTGPPQHYVAPFEFRIQSEGNTPCNILEEIIWHKDVEVAQLKERRPLFRLKNALDSAPPTKDFVGALRAAHQRTGLPSLIAEVKKASPSRGILREDFDPVHNEREMDRVLGIEGVELIGINNRNS